MTIDFRKIYFIIVYKYSKTEILALTIINIVIIGIYI